MTGLQRVRHPRWRDETGSMPLALLLIIIGISLSTLLATMVIAQITDTRHRAQRVRELAAAQAGLDAALAHIQAAHDGQLDDDENLIGDRTELPCSFEGTVSEGGARYRVEIRYLASDPHGQTDSWVDANAFNCTNGGVAKTPRYALLRAWGTDVRTGNVLDVANRYLRATYTFRTTNENIPGGLIYVHPASANLCLAADLVATKLTTRFCDETQRTQRWAYNSDLNLVLDESASDTAPLGLCLDAPAPSGFGATPVRLVACVEPASTPAAKLAAFRRQQWAFNAGANFAGVRTDGEAAAYCFHVSSPGSQSDVVLGSTCGGAYNNRATFSPQATVGAGMAGKAAGHLVNREQFGRCADVTGDTPGQFDFLIVWPCKQSATGKASPNQKWALPAVTPPAGATGNVVTYDQGNVNAPYCLKSPMSTFGYVDIVSCPGGSSGFADRRWTRYEEATVPENRYTLQDSGGRCLTPNTATNDWFVSGFEVSKLVVRPCDGTDLQKWNAPADVTDPAPLKDIGEDIGD